MTQAQIKEAEADIEILEVLLMYVEKNPHKEWCRGIDVKGYNSKLKFYRASLKDAIFDLTSIDEPF